MNALKSVISDPSIRYRALLITGSAIGILAAYSLSSKLSEYAVAKELNDIREAELSNQE